METFAHSRFAKLMLYLIMLSIGLSLVISNSCGGPIDQIFIGWRDSSICPDPSQITCLIGSAPDSGPLTFFVAPLMFVVMIFVINLFMSFVTKIWNRMH